TVRLLADLDEKKALIQRMAILKEARGHGYATLLINRLIEFAKESKLNKLELHAQLSAKGLYSKHGFNEVGQVFEEAGIQHIQMERTEFSD
ncbi:MAG: GNAT family N-acetyltransferase, partial [Lactococcus lactis]